MSLSPRVSVHPSILHSVSHCKNRTCFPSSREVPGPLVSHWSGCLTLSMTSRLGLSARRSHALTFEMHFHSGHFQAFPSQVLLTSLSLVLPLLWCLWSSLWASVMTLRPWTPLVAQIPVTKYTWAAAPAHYSLICAVSLLQE